MRKTLPGVDTNTDTDSDENKTLLVLKRRTRVKVKFRTLQSPKKGPFLRKKQVSAIDTFNAIPHFHSIEPTLMQQTT